MAGEVISAMQNVVDLCQDNDSDGPSLDKLVSSYKKVKSHLPHQIMHECGCCQCSDFTPLHMFASVVGGTGKSFLTKTIRGLVASLWDTVAGSKLCAVTASTVLAAFNVSGVTIHWLLQLPIEHEGRSAGYWRLGKEPLKVMCASLCKLKLLITDEGSVVSSLNLPYIHLDLNEIFAMCDEAAQHRVLSRPSKRGCFLY